MGRLPLKAREPSTAETGAVSTAAPDDRPPTHVGLRTAVLRPIQVLRPQPGEKPLLDRRGWRVLRADPVGLIAGTFFAMLAMTPSLLPRSWTFQAYLSGVSGAIGYGVGVLLAWLFRLTPAHPWLTRRLGLFVPVRVRRMAWPVLLAAVPIGLLVGLVIASDWQRQVRVLVGLPEETSAGWLRAMPVILLVAAVIIAFFRGLRFLVRLLTRLLSRWRLPRRVAQVVGLLVVTALTFGLFDNVVLSWALHVADTLSIAANDHTPTGAHRPTRSERSGSPASLSPWDTLGYYGQNFVSLGPSRAQMAAAADIPASQVKEPIRVYVGLKARSSAQGRAALALDELDRTHAWDRAVICVVTTTGNGWVDYHTPEALELMYGGNVATVATQYSFLPSWVAFLADRERAVEEGRAVVDAVSDRLSRMPKDHRPKLLVYGESLGATGSEAAFDGLADIRARADAVLWVGPPDSNKIWSQLVARRDPGSPEVAPVYSDGLVVRFGSRPQDWDSPSAPWLEPRVAYLMHPTDPVVWWSPRLLFARPDWLVEPRGDGVSPAMSWYPIVTFWQITADLGNALYVPDGYGHNYKQEMLDAWSRVAPPPGWTASDTARAHAALQ